MGGIYDDIIYGLRQILMNLVFFWSLLVFILKIIITVSLMCSITFIGWTKINLITQTSYDCTICCMKATFLYALYFVNKDILTIENSLLEKRVFLIGAWLVPTIKEKRWHCIRFQQLVSSNVLLPHVLFKMHLNNLRVRHYKRTEIIT